MGFNQGIDPGTFSLQLIDTLSQQIGQGHQQIKEQSFFDDLQSQIQQSQDPDQLFQTLLGSAFQSGAPQSARDQALKAAQVASQRERSTEIARLKEQEIDRRIDEADEKKRLKLKEKTDPLRLSLSTINEMRDIRASNNLGVSSGVRSTANPFGQTAADRQAWLTNARKLIGIANTPGLVIRNQKEFEAITGDLLNGNLSDAAGNSLLNQLERVVSEELELSLEGTGQTGQPQGEERIRVRLANGQIGNLPRSEVQDFLNANQGAKAIK